MSHGGSGVGKGMRRRSYPGDPRIHVVERSKKTRLDYINEERREAAEFKHEKAAAIQTRKDLHKAILEAGGISPFVYGTYRTGGGKFAEAELRKAIKDRRRNGRRDEELDGVPNSLIRNSQTKSLDKVADSVASQYSGSFLNKSSNDHFDLVRELEAVERRYDKYSGKPAKVDLRTPKQKRNRRPHVTKITRKPHPVPKTAKTKKLAGGRKWVLVKAHTRSCPKR